VLGLEEALVVLGRYRSCVGASCAFGSFDPVAAQHMVSKFTLLPIGLADLLVTVGVVRFVQKFIVKYVPPDEEE